MKNSATISFPFASMLAIVFITLKLCGVITWPWLWVLSPLWIPIAIIIGVLAVIALAAIVAVAIKHVCSR